MIIGFPPGGPTDAIGRVLMRGASEVLGVSIVIENRPGAGGNIAAQEVIRAQPDGYTFMYASSSITTAHLLDKRADLNPKIAFEAASCSTSVPLLILGSSAGYNSAQALFRAVRDTPDKVFLATAGAGALDHLTAVALEKRYGLKFQYVPYKGSGPALQDVAAGNVTFTITGAFNTALPLIQKGQIKALAVLAANRSKSLPDVPTLGEALSEQQGYAGSTWQAVVAPRHTPQAILEKINDAIKKAMKDPKVQESIRFQGAEVLDMTTQECHRFIHSETDRWAELPGINDLKLN